MSSLCPTCVEFQGCVKGLASCRSDIMDPDLVSCAEWKSCRGVELGADLFVSNWHVALRPFISSLIFGVEYARLGAEQQTSVNAHCAMLFHKRLKAEDRRLFGALWDGG